MQKQIHPVNSLIFSCLLCFISLHTFAFEKPMEWGKVTLNDLANMKDTTGKNYSAIILCDYGVMDFDVYMNKIRYIYTRHTRIKILNVKGYDYATVKFPYYSFAKVQALNDIDGQCFYLNENGRVEKKELEKKLVFNEKLNEYWSQVRFTIPGVKEGCIIEYKYTIYDFDYSDLRKWYFQNEIPVMRSELCMHVPDYFNIAPNYTGNIKLEPVEENSFTDHWNIDTRSNDPYARSNPVPNNDFKTTSETIVIPGVERRYVARNVPPLEEEPYIADLKNYWACMRFDMRSIRIPEFPTTELASSWESVLKQLNENTYFGVELEGNRYLFQSGSERTKNIADKKEKMKVIYELVRNNMNVDYGEKIFVHNLSKKWDDHLGTKSEINMILVKMLQGAGMLAQPVLISTQSHGPIMEFNPSWHQFNAVVARVTIDDKDFLLDATDKSRSFDILDQDDLNGSGLIYSLAKVQWIKIKNTSSSQSTSFAMASIDKEGKLTCSLSQNFDGYIGLDRRKDVKSAGLKTYLERSLTAVLPDVVISKCSVTNLDTISAPLKLQQEFSTSQLCSPSGDFLYISPLIGLIAREYSFTADKRILPVNLPNTIENNYIINISLPDGYKLSEEPKPVKIVLGNDAAVYTYMVAQVGNQLQLRSKLSIHDTHFEPSEYPQLKNFFSQVMNKDNEKLALKKNN